MSSDKHRQPTTLVEGGRRKEWRGRIVNPPLHRASTILFDSVAELKSAKRAFGEWTYALRGTPTQWALAEALTELEPGAAGTVLYPSGLAAITGALLAVLSAGDEIMVTDSVYGPTRHFCDTFLKRFGVATRYYDPMVGEEIADLIGPATKAILLESPGSLTMEVQDVPAICRIARERGVATLLDNTWATPLLFPAIAAGVDLTILAGTKYVGGHADILLGSVTAVPQYFEKLQAIAWDLGFHASPDDAWLGSRGIRTMAVRLKGHESSALKVAHWLKAQPQVGAMLHPAFPECPGHEHWKRDFKGSSGLFSFELKGADADARAPFVDRLELFGIGYSWGGYESLVLPVDPHRTVSKPPAASLVRLHIGLEDPDDLIDDLGRALSR